MWWARLFDWQGGLTLSYLWVWRPHFITPVTSNDWIGSFWKDDFDMLKSIEFGNVVNPLLSSRGFDRVCQGWFLEDFVEELFQSQASRQSVEAHLGFASIASSLSTRFQVYLSKCWILVSESRLKDTTCFLLFFLLGLNLLIFSLPLLWLRSKSTCLSPGLCIHRPRQ